MVLLLELVQKPGKLPRIRGARRFRQHDAGGRRRQERTQIVQRIYVQSPTVKGEVYNGVAYASYYTATKSD